VVGREHVLYFVGFIVYISDSYGKSEMKRKTKTFISFGYWFGALSLGLLIHPYLTLRKMVRDKLMRPLAFLPVVTVACLWVGSGIILTVGGLVFRALGIVPPWWLISSLEFLFWWVVWFLILWQVVLGYLLFRFLVVLR